MGALLIFITLSPLFLLLFLAIKFMAEDLFYIALVPAKYPKLKFSQFKKFYDVCPERWRLEDNYVKCIINYGHGECFSFNLFDFLFRYKPFLKYLDKAEEKEKEAQSYSYMIAAVKKDISEFEERCANETKSKIDEIWRNTK